jgi:hypothetical protein
MPGPAPPPPCGRRAAAGVQLTPDSATLDRLLATCTATIGNELVTSAGFGADVLTTLATCDVRPRARALVAARHGLPADCPRHGRPWPLPQPSARDAAPSPPAPSPLRRCRPSRARAPPSSPPRRARNARASRRPRATRPPPPLAPPPRPPRAPRAPPAPRRPPPWALAPRRLPPCSWPSPPPCSARLRELRLCAAARAAALRPRRRSDSLPGVSAARGRRRGRPDRPRAAGEPRGVRSTAGAARAATARAALRARRARWSRGAPGGWAQQKNPSAHPTTHTSPARGLRSALLASRRLDGRLTRAPPPIRRAPRRPRHEGRRGRAAAAGLRPGARPRAAGGRAPQRCAAPALPAPARSGAGLPGGLPMPGRVAVDAGAVAVDAADDRGQLHGPEGARAPPARPAPHAHARAWTAGRRAATAAAWGRRLPGRAGNAVWRRGPAPYGAPARRPPPAARCARPLPPLRAAPQPRAQYEIFTAPTWDGLQSAPQPVRWCGFAHFAQPAGCSFRLSPFEDVFVAIRTRRPGALLGISERPAQRAGGAGGLMAAHAPPPPRARGRRAGPPPAARARLPATACSPLRRHRRPHTCGCSFGLLTHSPARSPHLTPPASQSAAPRARTRRSAPLRRAAT